MNDEIQFKSSRSYLQKLRRDHRVRAMFDGWIAQATMEAEERFPHPRDERERTHFAAQKAVELAMSFVLDNDGELRMVEQERDQLRSQVLRGHELQTPRPIFLQTKEQQDQAR